MLTSAAANNSLPRCAAAGRADELAAGVRAAEHDERATRECGLAAREVRAGRPAKARSCLGAEGKGARKREEREGEKISEN